MWGLTCGQIHWIMVQIEDLVSVSTIIPLVSGESNPLCENLLRACLLSQSEDDISIDIQVYVT